MSKIITIRARMEASLDQLREQLREALRELRGEEAWLVDIFDGSIIYRSEERRMRANWSRGEDGKIILSDDTEVHTVYVDGPEEQIKSVSLTTTATMGLPQDPQGKSWEVVIIQAGETLNGWEFPEDVLRASAGLFDGVNVNLFEFGDGAGHLKPDLMGVKQFLTRNKVGWIDTVRYVAGEGLKGVLHFLDSAADLGRNLVQAQQQGQTIYGLSIDCPARASVVERAGKTIMRAVKILAADSVDIVSRPAAGGKFVRAVAAQEQGVDMNKEKLWKLIMGRRPDLLAGKTVESVSEDELITITQQALETAPAQPAAVPPAPQPPAPAVDEVGLLRTEMALEKALAKSELPEKAQGRVRGLFEGRVVQSAEIDKAIQAEKDYLAELTKTQDEPVPYGSASAGLTTLLKAQMAVDKMFGLTKDELTDLAKSRRLDGKPFFEDARSTQDMGEYDNVPQFEGLREMYAFFTGDPEVSGRFDKKRLKGDMRAAMDVTSATFTYVLGNTLARRLVADYRETNYREDLLISLSKSVRDFRQQEAVMVGYFPDIATVDPETGDYAEISGVTDEESTYSLGQKGNILTITRKTIINDDISLITRLVSRLGRAARRTHAKYVWGKFIDNATCSDGTAWFTGGHGNLGATALSYATALVAYQAIAKFAEKDSAERIGLLDDPSIKPVLIYPIDLMATAEGIVNEEYYYATNDLTDKTRNPLKGKITGAQLSLLTDANDWGLLLPPSLVDCVEMGYLNGRTEPEMFVADMPQSEQVFVADKIRHKLRHEYAGAVVDYRSGYKAVVA